ncbi:hypothetical protein GGI25_002124 [Coemansia spiralis]|uniref:ARID domain-containing protein n=1 Tax=Coemansia spiralis TaxID=417178 RepID=A0A9W8G4E2_9FUNG|nr:hypothetical protein GGI25_002124 [Coemansia spiralis]
MAFNNLPGQPTLQSAGSQTGDASTNIMQQNTPSGLINSQQRLPPQQVQQQIQQIQQYYFQQLQQLHNLQMQLQAQEQNPQQNQTPLPYTSQQIAMARQSLMVQQQQQLALLAQQQQQQQPQSLAQNTHALSGQNATSMVLQPNVHHLSAGSAASAIPIQSSVVGPGAWSSVAVMPPASLSATTPDSNKAQAARDINGGSNAQSPVNNHQSPGTINMAVLRATAARFGLNESMQSRFTPNQLQVFVSNLQAQHIQQVQQSQFPDTSSTGVPTPQRQKSATPLPTNSNGNGNTTAALTSKPASDASKIPASRSKKRVAHDRSESRSPAPVQPHNQAHGNSHIFMPTALHASQKSPSVLGSPIGVANSPRSVQRKGSAASIPAEDMRATPTPSETSTTGPAGGQIQQTNYSAEEIASALKKSEEFVKKLPGFTSESFVEFLQKFLKENNISGNFTKPPVFAERPIDLYRFFCEVVNQGGLEQVHTRRIWRQVAKDSGLPDIATLPPLLSRWYKVWLQPLEQLAVYPPGHPKHTGVTANFSLKKRRKHDAFHSPGSTPGPSDRPYSVNSESSKRPKMYSPITNGVASATASPAQFTPPPPLPLSNSVMHLPTVSMGISPANASSAPAFPTNGFTPTLDRTLQLPHIPTPVGHNQSGAAGSAAGILANPAMAHPSMSLSSQQQPQQQRQQSDLSNSHTPSKSIVTIPPPPPAPKPLHFFPLERTLDTYGGIDIQACMALHPRIRQPSISEYGSVDIRALTLSIESGIAMEVTAALNTLIRITSHPDVVIPLNQCEELAEMLFTVIESIKLPSAYCKIDRAVGGKAGKADESQEKEGLTYSEETTLFSAVCANDPNDGGILGDDMQDPTSVCGLLHGNSELWSFTSDRTLTIMYALRNLSFLPANQQYLSRSNDFLHMFGTILELCDSAVKAAQRQSSDREKDDPYSERLASLMVLQAIELRKSLMVMLANVADKLDLKSTGTDFVYVALQLISYFMDEKQTSDVVEEWMRDSLSPTTAAGTNDLLAATLYVQALDGRTYYLHALEAAGRMSVSAENREFLAGSVSPDAYWPLANACASLLTGNQAAVSLNPGAVHNFGEQRLMWVQMALVALSNVVCTVTPQPLVAARRYTPFRISAGGMIGNFAQANGTPATSLDMNGKNNSGMATGAIAGTSRRAMSRRAMPFMPVIYTSKAVPVALKDFRKRLVKNDSMVRSLFEMVFMWWVQIGAAANLRTHSGPLSPPAPHDSPLNDIAERAVYVLQQLHPEHDALFASRWGEWVVERATRGPLCPELTEILYELTGMIPVQSTSFSASSTP